MTLTQIQRELDRRILQTMEECRDPGYPRHGFAFCFARFVEPGLTRDMARALCRSLTDRGYCFYMLGLWNEDGHPIGAGYGITDKGAAYLETLIADDEAQP